MAEYGRTASFSRPGLQRSWNAAMDTDSKSKSTRVINMTKQGGIRWFMYEHIVTAMYLQSILK